jgi:hypothetical protein
MALQALSPEAAAALGLDAGERERLLGTDLGTLPLSEALRLARALRGSLTWLAGSTTTKGRPPAADAVLDLVRIHELIRESRLAERTLLETLGLGLGPWRRMRRGSLEPTAAQLLGLAGVLRVDAESLLRSP